MIWVDREAKKIKERAYPLEWVDDMKTPSGRIHVGALRGVVVYDLIYKALRENGVSAKFTYVFEDHDPMDAIPSYLDFKKWEKYAGMQLYKIPSPYPGFKNYAHFYASEFQGVFEKIGCHPKIIWGSKLYLSGKMNAVIKEVLDGTPKIRKIYERIAQAKKPADWHPFNVICEECGKIGTTLVWKWDGTHVHYRCMPQMVAWAVGCGKTGKMSPYDGRGKIPWKVEWAAKWKVIGVTVEGAGKDHMSKGGSYDVASAVCKEVLNCEPPYPIAYEWFTVGGRKMSSSKGIGASAYEVSQLLPSDVLRFFIVRTPIRTALDFDPRSEAIVNIFDDFDRCFSAYYTVQEGNVPAGKQGEVIVDFARIFELSIIKKAPKRRVFLPRFRTIIRMIGEGPNREANEREILHFFTTQKEKPLTVFEKELVRERIDCARSYLQTHTISPARKVTAPSPQNFTQKQKEFLLQLTKELQKLHHPSKETIQSTLFSLLKKKQFSPREVFPAFYTVLIGKTYGPKAGELIADMGMEKTIEKIKGFVKNI